MSSVKATLDGYVRYRGREGQLSFLLHRLTGLGTVLFLTIHILDTATVYFYPQLYDHAIALYQTTLFGIGELFLVFSVLYHGTNGIRITIFDWKPQLWKIENERKWAIGILIFTIVIWLPLAARMINGILVHNYNIHLFGG
jgi:succinate dehydrogenase / fumarate reductase, cytochrome b subunit